MLNPKVFIIILHYGSTKDTEECLKSLEKLDYDNHKIIVVDNDPKNNFQFPNSNFQIKYIKNKENLGFAGGNNIGIKYALEKKADYILLLNNDTIVDPSFLKKLIEAGESDKKIGILGPVIYKYSSTNPGQEIHFAGGKINWLFTKGKHITNLCPKSQIINLKKTDYITGCCMLVKREVIEKIGLIPEEYFLYFEDVEWCLKARKKGFKCILVPTSKIWHKVSRNASEGSFSYIYYHTRNGLLLSKRNAPFFIKTLAYLNGFGTYKKQIIKWLILPKKRKWAKAMMRGIEDFYGKKYGKFKNRN